jgi:hypothetical protein
VGGGGRPGRRQGQRQASAARRALLALDGAEDMQGGYVQLTRSKHRTDLYLTVGPEPLGPDDERPHPRAAPSSGTSVGWKPMTPTCGLGSGRWPGRMPGGGGSTSTRWRWTRRAGCWPNSAPSPATRWSGRCGARPPRSWTAIGALVALTTPGRRSMLGPGWPGIGGRRHRPPVPPLPSGPAEHERRGSAVATASRAADRPRQCGHRWPLRNATGSGWTNCGAANPAGANLANGVTGRPSGPRWSAWPTTTAAAVRTATAHTSEPVDCVAATSASRNATAASWLKGAAHAPAHRRLPP